MVKRKLTTLRMLLVIEIFLLALKVISSLEHSQHQKWSFLNFLYSGNS